MEHFFSEKTTPLIELKAPVFNEKHLRVWVKRDDLNHPLIQGNKWHKLRLNLLQAQKHSASTLITFGGAYSNHIAATAAAAKEFGFKSLGLIRGDELAENKENWSPTLEQAALNGMQFEFLSRRDYRRRHEADFIHTYRQRYPDGYFIPEGGSNDLAIEGLQILAQQIDAQCPDWSRLYCSVGTGATLAGLIRHTAYRANKQLIGVCSIKQGDYLIHDIRRWIGDATKHNRWILDTEHHFGGYAKQPPELQQFMHSFQQEFSIELDPVYTAKTFKTFFEDIEQNRLPAGSQVILLHSGGLQGK
ncbi:1-aminocyclopropane-1-carboxylate deaminase/D-cysteine desulfhydrase [Thiomicrorhabdus heinhorstiae]|uniref:Pyridoxal-phosphate dependent enzyme n=1 Tax=Thiomicrorhabdus heinhorstiae TaxID=2748010 RepID=A0ABS0BT93_9GAMM|nr:pyridoxal-phosphate dependent enzyme [Thiomicrorhabdus heinhorstiae]MBF6057056.1 pyridoxal-phosphate dependent enzyme [Thiomicrorhabdus heinhorstiae]